MKIEIVRLDKSLPLPAYQHIGEDVGLDLRAAEEVIIKRGEFQLIKTGIKLAIPPGYGGFVYPRSGLALKHGITVLNCVGVIDPGYRGELGVVLINHGKEDFKVNKGDRIAQLIIHRTIQIEWEEVEELSDSERGKGGFGHTGV
ncbi:MAG TPA: dUTP diphosphatase [Halanaerobiaceae bacterium]|jgi:dUTP pyrophosphatase|nr:dUTP diphosphatase [Halanaerobiaceae bacterium]HOA40439.1 dUTP diphosphatase [Halanaerobiales bacterium]HPZ62585.1 dUTP diphosphatase [Halanaerobiales bacterium]HQD03119.1 dUTP diphosphatase [Halanaerobiales bacterium]